MGFDINLTDDRIKQRSKNKYNHTMKQAERETTARDRFVIEKYQEGFSGEEIRILLRKNNFKGITRARIYQILENNGVAIRKK
jgi:hypothetical protein